MAKQSMQVASLVFVASLFLALGGCRRSDPPVEYAPVGSLREVMQSIVEPNADFVWNSFSIIITSKGEEHKMPHTDEEWQIVRNHGLALVEATNLLLIPNRHIAPPGVGADNPEFERDPKDIEGMMSRDRATFLNHIGGLRQASTKMLAALDSKDLLAIDEAGANLDKACEDCHTTYWYLPDK